MGGPGWQQTSEISVIRFISDSASANVKLFDCAAVPNRGRSLMLHQLCEMYLGQQVYCAADLVQIFG